MATVPFDPHPTEQIDMAYLFPSAEWLAQFQIEISRSASYAVSARTWEGDC